MEPFASVLSLQILRMKLRLMDINYHGLVSWNYKFRLYSAAVGRVTADAADQ